MSTDGVRPQLAVRYCGGCNPRYDRVALVKRLESLLECSFPAAQPGIAYTAVVVACGCPSRCAGVSDLALRPGNLVFLSGWEDLLSAKKRLLELCEQAGEEQARSLTHQEVLAILPHRPPMLFVDTVDHLLPGVEVNARFTLRPELEVFAGHFPGSPVFPGALSVEAMAQAADLLLLTLARYAGKQPLFMGIRKASFRRRLQPGDTLELRACLLEERPELGYALCQGQIFTAGALAAEAQLQLSLR